MKKMLRRILSFVMLVCIAFMGVFTMPMVSAKAEGAASCYVKVTAELSNWSGDYLIVYEDENVAFNGGLDTLDAENNTISVEIKDGQIEANANTNAANFTIAAVDGGYTIQSASNHYIGQTSDANGLKSDETTAYTNTISLNDEIANIISGGAYLRFNSASNQRRFRYYKSTSYTGQKAICLYKLSEGDTPPSVTVSTEASMSLAYEYTAITETVEVTGGKSTDMLNRETIGVTGTSYTDWSGIKTATSSAVYAGQSAGGNESIQLRSSNSNSGIITTTSGGKATKIVIEWNDSTASGRTLDVYGKGTAYAAATDLYNSSTQGTKIGSIVCGTSTELAIEEDYAYIGLRSNSGAMYLTSVAITWESEAGYVEETTCSDSEFQIRCGVEASLAEMEDIGTYTYGIRVSTSITKKVDYPSNELSYEEKNGEKYYYIVISLGDIINDTTNLTTEFTVQAYVTVGGATYVSTSKKTYSVASMIQEYYEELNIAEVEHLYKYLVEKGIIVEGVA